MVRWKVGRASLAGENEGEASTCFGKTIERIQDAGKRAIAVLVSVCVGISN
jgi:hypothetical protein